VTAADKSPDPVGTGVAALGENGAGGAESRSGAAAGPPPGGRRTRMQGGRSRAVLVRVSEDEHQRLRAMAGGAGVSVPRLLIEAALGADGPTPAERRAQFAALLAARRQLAGAATNLNQLARWANTEGRWPPGAEPAAAAVERATARLEAALEALQL
jgi:hypothetical protein